jgi:L-rhamnose isomerase/sugar isomerase
VSDVAAIKAALAAQEIETPSWAYGNSGTRFKVFAQPGVPRTVKEKVDDAATVHRFTGVALSVALLPPYPGVCAPDTCQQTASNKTSQRNTLHRVTSKPSAC